MSQNLLARSICVSQNAGMPSAREIIDAFGYASLARILSLPSGTVSAWKSRNAIPQPYWREIEAEARRRRLATVTYAALEAAARPARRRAQVTVEAHA